MPKNYTPHPSYVQIDSAREMYQQAIGAHPDQSRYTFVIPYDRPELFLQSRDRQHHIP